MAPLSRPEMARCWQKPSMMHFSIAIKFPQLESGMLSASQRNTGSATTETNFHVYIDRCSAGHKR